MIRHLATYALTRVYSTFASTKERGDEDAIAEAMARPEPAPWGRGWTLDQVGEPVHTATSEYGVTVERETRWTITLPILESTARNAARVANEEALTFAGYNDRGPEMRDPLWNGSHEKSEARVIGLVKDDQGTRLKHQIDLPWRLLVTPDAGSFPYPYGLDQAFEALRYLALSGLGYERQDRWTTYTLAQLLSQTKDNVSLSGFSSYHSVRPVTSIADLKSRFLYALLGDRESFYQDWRDAMNIALDTSISFRCPHRGKAFHPITLPGKHNSVAVHEALTNMLEGARGMTLTPQLNPVHEQARNIRTVKVAIGKEGFDFIVDYGFQGSTWSTSIAASRKGEPFVDTLQRAYAIFMTDMVPDFDEQRRKAWDEQHEHSFAD